MGEGAAWWAAGGAAAAAMLLVLLVLDAAVRGLHGWYREVALGEARRARLPPGEMGWPVVGAMWAFLRAFKSGQPDAFIGAFVRRSVSSNQFGRTGVYRAFMFSSPTILVTTPEACKQVLMDDEGFVTGWPKATVALIGPKSFVAMPYDEHRRLRKLTAAPINGFDALTAYLPFIDRTVTSSLRSWADVSADGGEVEFLTELRRMTFKIIVQIFLGGADDATMHALERSYTNLNYGMRAMAINLPGFAYRRALGARRRLVSVLQGVLDERRAATAKGFTRSSGVDMMDRLVEVEDEHGRRLDDDEIIDILIMYLNAGHESSGHITMWATVFLQENPDVFAKAKAEQEAIVRSIPATQQRLTLRDFRKMEYLSKIPFFDNAPNQQSYVDELYLKVIDETLRLVNISFVSFRQATKDVFVNGYLIPKGWKVQLWYRSVHMDPQVYPDPSKFNPSRWEGHSPRAGTFLPFGLGARLCPGNDLAKLEISVFLHHFLLGYKLTRTNPNCRVRYLPHPRPVDNCLAKVTKVSDEY
ncbi:Cytochrome P450 88A1 [Dichanthelium oligosanthes]|uniref:Cytochrome P450 88A1 n=1 Tax=Dichanthelium oligosanthes TaxID=888268 RepID=A0A1E5V559_9POAL|nr:Cytochrome P450 88A1 [Dichanthelium oligosanthes]